MNVGIILAMAGVDYSNVKEPGYDFTKLRQSDQITRVIERTCDSVLSNWNARELIRMRMKGNKKFDKRRRSIMYDTDGFYEHQNETIRICTECAGVLKIDSTSDVGQHILAVHIPRKACHACREQGFEWYDGAHPAVMTWSSVRTARKIPIWCGENSCFPKPPSRKNRQ
ncbi:MAG: hypothetical protein R2875_03245 [Desulfobacterales bacterium]